MRGQRYPTADEYDPDYNYKRDDAPEPPEMAEQMGLARGTDWTHPDGGDPIRVVAGGGDEVTITDPTVTRQLDSRAGNWYHPVVELYENWRQGSLVPAAASEGFDPAPPGEDAAPELVEQVSADGPRATVAFGGPEADVRVTLLDADGEEVDKLTLSAVEVSEAQANGATYALGPDGRDE